jgi:hypothetical protein
MLMQVMMYVVDGQFIHLDLVEEKGQMKKIISVRTMQLKSIKSHLNKQKRFILEKKGENVKVAVVIAFLALIAVVLPVQALHVLARHVIHTQVVQYQLPPSTLQEH